MIESRRADDARGPTPRGPRARRCPSQLEPRVLSLFDGEDVTRPMDVRTLGGVAFPCHADLLAITLASCCQQRHRPTKLTARALPPRIVPTPPAGLLRWMHARATDLLAAPARAQHGAWGSGFDDVFVECRLLERRVLTQAPLAVRARASTSTVTSSSLAGLVVSENGRRTKRRALSFGGDHRA